MSPAVPSIVRSRQLRMVISGVRPEMSVNMILRRCKSEIEHSRVSVRSRQVTHWSVMGRRGAARVKSKMVPTGHSRTLHS